MTLDSGKIARVVANRALIRAGRAIQVAAVYRTAYGGQRAAAVSLILKAQGTSDPAAVDQTVVNANEYLAELPLEIDPRGIAFLALTGGAIDDASIAAAICLEILAYRLSGLVPNRWQLTLRRLRWCGCSPAERGGENNADRAVACLDEQCCLQSAHARRCVDEAAAGHLRPGRSLATLGR